MQANSRVSTLHPFDQILALEHRFVVINFFMPVKSIAALLFQPLPSVHLHKNRVLFQTLMF